MTTHIQKTCAHCGTDYYYQGSGYGCLDTCNDPNYCEDCKCVIIDALCSRVPVKFEKRWVDIKKLGPEYQYITKEKILEWDKAIEENRKGKFHWRRVAFPLFDLQNPNNTNECIILNVPEGQFKGTEVQYSYWTLNTEWDQIMVNVKWDLINDKQV